jgi:hypothetical protein
MGIFTKKTDEASLTALRARAGVLEGRRAAAQTALDELLARRQKFLLEADLDSDEKPLSASRRIFWPGRRAYLAWLTRSTSFPRGLVQLKPSLPPSATPLHGLRLRRG